jgi:hypothetical protein
MDEAKKPGPKETQLRIDPDKFAAAMDRVATDEKLQEKLDNNPVEALKELGIEIDKESHEALKDKSLAEIMGLTEEEAAAMKRAPIVAPLPVAIQPKSRVISTVGGITICRPIVPCVKTVPRSVAMPGPVILVDKGSHPLSTADTATQAEPAKKKGKKI